MAEESMFDDMGGDSDFEVLKPKAKAAPKATKKTTTAKAAPKRTTQPASKTVVKAKPVSKKRPKPDSEDDASGVEGNAFDDESLLTHTPPKAKKAKPTAAPSKSSKKPLADVVNEAMAADGTAEEKPKKGKRVSEQYQMISHLEHIIKRPDTYIGSTERTERQTWVYNTASDGMEYREVSYVPGLYKIFDEILVNAADNKQNDKNMDEIKVAIDREQGEISVWNNGRGIPIEIHSKQKIYIPEMIFGNLLSSSNYDDDQQKVTGGRNGYGAKLCNIFSTEFTVETADARKKKKYKQTWTSNMSVKGNAKIVDFNGDDYTKVTFKPDFAKFGMTGLDDDFEALAKRRVYDLAGTCKGVSVRLNNVRVPVRSFKAYMKMYTKGIKSERGEEAAHDQSDIIHDVPHPRWEIGFAVSDGSFQQVSFANSIATTSGGTHVNYISDQICNKLAEHLKKKNKGGPALKINQIRNHIFLFVNCQIVNPAFTSQTKEQLTTKPSQFGSTCTISDSFMKSVQKTEVIANILAFLEKKADQILKKSDGSKRSRVSNPKLIDANKAGTKEGHQCTLILTEGDSAKGLAVAGRSMVGPDLFGVFPLRGKLLNVRDASIDQISKNVEIQNIKNFMGLQHKKEYTDTKGLRYGHLMIMTDQDHDGSHIKGLLINFLQVSFPSLLRIPGFLLEFITPIVKTWRGPINKPHEVHTFYTMPEYEVFKEAHKHEAKKWEHKYYKGLGTSTTEDAQRYFADLDRHLKRFHTMRDYEVNLIDLAFSKKRADERKAWLGEFKPGTFLDHGEVKEICYDDFVNKELILFSMADNIRSIPSMIDGLKPGQRKVLYTCFRRNLQKDVKVAELAGSVSEMTHYAHGETSLQQTIVGLAQTFVGSNNLNCLEPSGNFGSRLQGGSDAASARYIFTRLSPFAKKIFHPADEPLLTHNLNEGKKIEPQTYVPVVPLVLINGADGIGTGWSSSIPNYSPEDIVANLKRLMDGEALVPMQPWFRGFQGTVQEGGPDRFKFNGIAKKTGNNEIEITELPIRVWTQDFKDKLEDIIKAEKIPSFIKDYKDYNTHEKVRFVIQMEEKYMPSGGDDEVSKELEDKFKLSKSVATSNLVAFDAEGRIAKYASVEDIIKDFFRVRIMFYEKRKQWQLADMQRELDKLSNQARFVQMIIDKKLTISRKKKSVLMAELKKLGFKIFSGVEDAKNEGEEQQVVDESESEEDAAMGAHDYDYLLGMPLWSLTQERVEKLRRQIGDVEMEVDKLIKLTKEDLWKRDLDLFIEEWRLQLDEEHKRKRRVNNMGRRTSKQVKVAASGPTFKKRKGLGDEDFDDDFEDRPKAKKPALPKVKRQEITVDKNKESVFKNWLTGEKTQGKNPVRSVDGNSSEAEPAVVNGMDAAVPQKKSTVAAKAKPVLVAAAIPNPTDSDEEVITKPAARKARAAASKPIRYGGGSDSDDSNGDDLLGDITNMVKGLPGGETKPSSSTNSKSLLSTSRAIPTSSINSLKPALSSLSTKYAEISDDDETNFTALVPQQSPRRSINVTKNANLTDDEDEDEGNFQLLTTTTTTTTNKKSRGLQAAAKPANPAPVTKAKPVAARLDSDIEDRDEDGYTDEEDEVVVTKPKPRAAPASAATKPAKPVPATKAKPIAPRADSDLEDKDAEDAEDDYTDDDDEVVIPKSKSRPAPAAAAAVAASKPAKATKAAAPPKKPAAATSKKTKSAPAPAPAAAKKKKTTAGSSAGASAITPLSPAAKAYAAKKAKSRLLDFDDEDKEEDEVDTGTTGGDEDAMDVDAMADDLLNSPVLAVAKSKAKGKKVMEVEKKKEKPAPAVTGGEGGATGATGGEGGGRPARRAAVQKKKPVYVISDDDEDADSEEEGGAGIRDGRDGMEDGDDSEEDYGESD